MGRVRYAYTFVPQQRRVYSARMTSDPRQFQTALSGVFEGNPLGKMLWDAVWKLPVMQPGKPGSSPTSFGDAANVLKANILQIYGNEPSIDGAPVAEGEVEGLLEGSLFLALWTYYEKVGGKNNLPLVSLICCINLCLTHAHALSSF